MPTGKPELDRAALVLRNRRMAEAFHTVPLKHQVRRVILQLVSAAPVPAVKAPLVERFLLVRPDHLGDVLLTTPAIHALRAARPHAEIHVLVGHWSAEVVAGYPEVDMVLTLPFPGFSRSPKTNWRAPYELLVNSARHLRRIGYSSAVILRPDHWWGAALAKLAGIPERVGYDLPDVAPFLTKAVQHEHQHAVVQNLKLMEKWTGKSEPESSQYYFPVEAFDRAYIDGYLREWGIEPKQPIFCIHPGTGTWVKHWEEDKWAAAADILIEQLDARVVMTGSQHELPLVRRITGQMKHEAVITAGDTRIGQLAALFSRARVVLGPDSGPLHLATAVGVPTVALYGPADPVEFGSWGSSDKHIILTSDIGCRPCRVLDWAGDAPEDHPCLREISVARVLEAARRAAQSTNPV
jgi:lipopolysaccharide heptosyltransferase II